MVMILFLLAGLLVGGAWAAYQNGAKYWTLIAGILATVTLGAAVAWMVSASGLV
ncbi:hypothetical protein [Corynebacterium lizhenjunii]|nr:hypothetical protein [Corynebacterium lizhenjunii]